MSEDEKIKIGHVVRVWRGDRTVEVDLIDATEDEVEIWFEQKKRYGDNILLSCLKILLDLIRSLQKELVEEKKSKTQTKSKTKEGK